MDASCTEMAGTRGGWQRAASDWRINEACAENEIAFEAAPDSGVCHSLAIDDGDGAPSELHGFVERAVRRVRRHIPGQIMLIVCICNDKEMHGQTGAFDCKKRHSERSLTRPHVQARASTRESETKRVRHTTYMHTPNMVRQA